MLDNKTNIKIFKIIIVSFIFCFFLGYLFSFNYKDWSITINKKEEPIKMVYIFSKKIWFLFLLFLSTKLKKRIVSILLITIFVIVDGITLGSLIISNGAVGLKIFFRSNFLNIIFFYPFFVIYIINPVLKGLNKIFKYEILGVIVTVIYTILKFYLNK